MSVSDGEMKLWRNEKASGSIKRGEEGENRNSICNSVGQDLYYDLLYKFVC